MNIERAQSEIEKDLNSGGFKNVKTWRQSDIKHFGAAKIAEVSQKIIYKERKPYCFKCAHKAVDDRIQKIGEEIKERSSRGDYDQKIELKLDFESFGDIKRFTPVVDNEIEKVKETTLIGGMKQSQITGVYKNYVCKKCQGKCQVYFDNLELEAENTKKDGKSQTPQS